MNNWDYLRLNTWTLVRIFMNPLIFRYFLYLPFSVTALMCSSNLNQKEPELAFLVVHDSTSVTKPKFASDSLGKSFDNQKAFEILSLRKHISSASSDPDTTKCSSWKLSKRQLLQIIKHSKEISGTEWDLGYEHLRCIIKGQLLQNGKKFNYTLNAGSWMWLQSRDTTVLFGNENKADEKYFLSSPYKE